MRKRLILFVLTLLTLFFIPSKVTNLEAAEQHVHKVSTSCETEDGTTFESFSEAIAASRTLSTGSYYLDTNIKLTNMGYKFTIPSNAVVDICLNGYEIYCYTNTGTASIRYIFDIQEGGILNICDCEPNRVATSHTYLNTIAGGVIGGGKGYNNTRGGAIYNKGTLNMYGGSIAKNATTSKTAAAYGICNLGEFNLYDGNIVQNVGYNEGGAVFVGEQSTFNMYGGYISNNSMYNNTYGYGAGVYVRGGTFYMHDGTISGNTCAYQSSGGAGVYLISASTSPYYTASFIMEGGTISGNQITSSGDGAGVCASGGSEFIMKDGKITGNFCANGGAISLWKSANTSIPTTTFTMEGGTISGNTVSGSGGAIYMRTGTVAKISGTIKNNIAQTYGGAIYGADADITLSKDSVIKGNTASGYGGGIILLSNSTNGSLNIEGGTIQGNTSTTASGGGIFIQGSTLNMSDGNLINNDASTSGGGISLRGSSNFFMSGGRITGNEADVGGGVYLSAPNSMYFSGTCTIKDNFAKDQQSNLYIPVNTAKFISVGKKSDGTASALSEDSIIGVTVPSTSLKANTVLSNGNDADYSKCFVSDASGYAVANSRINKLYLTNTYSITWENVTDENWPSEITAPDEYLYGIGLANLPQPVREGYRFEGWYSEETLENEVTNISTETTGALTLWAKWTDSQGPDLNITFADEKNSKSWYDNASLIIEYKDREESESIELYVKIDDGDYTLLTDISSGDAYEITEEGEHTYTFQAKDASGNTTETAPITVKLDRTAPVFGTVSYPDKKSETDGWVIGQKSLHILIPVIEEGSGVSKADYVLTSDDGVVQKGSVAVVNGENGQEAEIVIAAEWKGTIQISCTDALGNCSEEKLIGVPGGGVIVDKHAPVIRTKAGNATLPTDQEFSVAPILTVTVNDGNGQVVSSGIQSITYQIGNDQAVSAAGLTSLQEEKEFSIDLNGRTGKVNVSITAVDFAGNETTKTYTVNIASKEEVPPTTETPTTPAVTVPGTPTPTAAASTTTKIKVSWKAVKGAAGYQVYRYNTKTKKFVQLKKTTKTSITDTNLTPGTVYTYKVRAYTVNGTKTVMGKASKAVRAVTRPRTPEIISAKKKSSTKADIKIRTVKNVKGYRIYEYMSSSKKFKLIGKIEGKVYYTYNSKTKKFTRDKDSKVVLQSKGSVTQVTIRTANVNFKKYKRYRYKVRAYVTYNGRNIYSGYSKVKIIKR